MNEEIPVQPNNNKSSNAINWTTIALIVLTGGGNLLQTKAGIDLNETEIRRATQEVHELYPKLEEAIQRQKRMQETLDQVLRSRP